MTESFSDRVDRLYDELCELSVDDRRARLASIEDERLRDEVGSLLQFDRATGFLVSEPSRRVDAMPETIGSYRLVREIGSGGMGRVFEAEQAQPKRRVAIKVMHAGIMSAATRQRFERESELLGRLVHPGIAQVYDAGSDESGMPYLAMEFIDGVSVRDFAETSGLDLDARLRLLAKLCDAVEHAHQKGVIHRDLKPGNILVTADGQPKVLDFGIAATIDDDGQPRQTLAGQLIGTVDYMSPEQAAGKQADVDTRTDVYALGVIAFELLTGGTHPRDLDEMSMADALQAIATRDVRRITSVAPAVRGDIATIVHTALSLDRGRRYGTAAEFGADIRRYLAHEPIQARPATATYQLRMFARRHRGLVAALMLATASLVVAAVWSAVAAADARASAARESEAADREAKANRAAQKNLAKAEEAADREAKANRASRQSLAKAEAVNEFLTERLLKSVRPNVRPGEVVTLLEVLEQAASQVGEAFAGQPDLEASVRLVLGQSLSELGAYDSAMEQLKAAVVLYRDLRLEEHRVDLATALHRLGNTHGFLRDDRAELEAQQGALDVLEGDSHAVELRGRILAQMARAYANLNEPDAALPIADRAIAVAEEALVREFGAEWASAPPVSRAHPKSQLLANLSSAIHARASAVPADLAQCIALGERALAVIRGVESPNTPLAWALGRLGRAYTNNREFAKAEAVHRESVGMYRVLLGETHTDLATELCNQGRALVELRQFDDAAEVLRESLRIWDESGSTDVGSIATTRLVHGRVLAALGDPEAARREYESAAEVARSMPQPVNGVLSDALGKLGFLTAFQMGDHEAGVRAFRERIEVCKALHGRTHPMTLNSMSLLAEAMRRGGDLEGALATHERVLESALANPILGPDDWRTANMRSSLARVLLDSGKPGSALEHLLLAEKVLIAKFGAESRHVKGIQGGIRAARKALGK